MSRPPVEPFWKRKRLDEMTAEEWESLCDGCGRCCVFRLEDEHTGERLGTNVCCDLFDIDTCRCTDYRRRSVRQPLCITLTPVQVEEDPSWLPATCAYRRLAEREGLAWWHPLVSGDPRTVVEAGISVRGRVVHARFADDLEHHVVGSEDWMDE